MGVKEKGRPQIQYVSTKLPKVRHEYKNMSHNIITCSLGNAIDWRGILKEK